MIRRFLTHPLFFALAGGLAGILAGLLLGILGLTLLDTEAKTMESTTLPTTYDIEVVVEEDYINRIMVESAGEIAGGVQLVAGHLDLLPGGTADFQARLRRGPFEPVVEGTLGFRASSTGSIEVVLLEAQMGRLPLTGLVPKGALDNVNADIEGQIVERVRSADMDLVGVSTDETSLRLFLESSE
ncbi:MAG: hypothetical protein ACLFU8_07655 [Anaerolineales bacterium]